MPSSASPAPRPAATPAATTPSGASSARPPKGPGQRRYDLDLLYIVSLGGIMVSHAMLPFAPPRPWLPPYSLTDVGEVSTLWNWITLYTGITFMPLFFVLAGWTSLAAWSAKGTGPFLSERVKRLGVPLLFGTIAFMPVIKHIELLMGFDFRISGPRYIPPADVDFWDTYLRFFTRLNQTTWGHLYFLAYLLAISFVTVPALWLMDRYGRLTALQPDRRVPFWVAYLPLLPMAGVLLATGGWWPYYPTLFTEGRILLNYISWFLLGAFLSRNPALEKAMDGEWWRLGLVGLAGLVWHGYEPMGWQGQIASAVFGWGCIGFYLGVAKRLRPTGGPALSYLRDATLPVYVLHNVIFVCWGYWVIKLDWGKLPEALLIFVPGLAVTFLLYHFLIRRVPVLGFLFGLRVKRRPRQRPIPAAG